MGWSMRTCLCVAVVMMISLAMFAQMPVGGTFSNVQTAQPVVYGTPIVSPPTMTLGNGLTPTVITNRQVFVVGAPQFVTQDNSNSSTGSAGAGENSQEQQTTAGTQQAPVRRRFDFVVTSGGAGTSNVSGDTRSLVEVAAATRKTHVTPAAGKAYTNDDVGRMNQKYGVQPQTTNPGTPETGTGQQPAPVQNQQNQGNANPVKR
jgi:hypothetical protein